MDNICTYPCRQPHLAARVTLSYVLPVEVFANFRDLGPGLVQAAQMLGTDARFMKGHDVFLTGRWFRLPTLTVFISRAEKMGWCKTSAGARRGKRKGCGLCPPVNCYDRTITK